MNSICHQPLSFKQRNFIVVWFDDPALSIANNVQKTIADVQHIVGTLTIFDDADKCVEYVNNVKDRQILLIVGESVGAQVVRRVLHVSKLQSVYIRCSNQSIHPPWAAGCQPLKCIFVDSTSICERIEIDTEDNSIDFDVTDGKSISSATSENRNKQDAKFMYSQLLKYTLTEMTYENDDIDNLIRFFKEKCKDQTKDMEKIKKFKDNYKEKPIWCYSNYVFLYVTLNSALRTCNADVICTMGVFIKSLHQEIVKLHETMRSPETLKLYRGQVISTSAFEEIQKNKGGLLSFNCFLSTSLDKRPADMYADQPPSDQTGVLFEITVTRSMSTSVAYANIQRESQYKDEEEYLFTIGSVFRIESVEQLDGDRKWCVHLALTTDRDPQLSELTNHMRSELPQQDLFSLCTLLYQMGDFKKVIELSEVAIKAPKNKPELPILYAILGCAHVGMGNHHSALINLELSLKYSSRSSTDEGTSDYIHMTKGMIFLLQGNLDAALTNIQAFKQKIHECTNDRVQQEMLFICDALMSMILQRQGHFSDALEYQTSAYDTAKGRLPVKHPVIGELLNSFSTTYLVTNQLDKALSCAEQSLGIHQDSLLPKHINQLHSQIVHEMIRRMKKNPSISVVSTPSLSTSLQEWQSDPQRNPLELLLLAMYSQGNKIDESLAILNEYFNVQEENLSSEHLDLAMAYFLRGGLYMKKKNFTEALENLEKGRKIATQHFGETHPVRIDYMLLIAEIHAEQGNNDEALNIVDQYKGLVSQASEIAVQTYGIKRLNRIGLGFKLQGSRHSRSKDYKKALSAFQNCLKIQIEFSPHEYRDVGNTYKRIASVHFDMGNYSDALINYQQAQDVFEKCLSPDDPEIAETYERIGQIFCIQEKYSDAIVSYRKAVDIQLKHLPENDPKFISTYRILGALYFDVQRYSDALFAFEKLLEIQSITLPSGSIDIAETYKRIARIYYDTKQYEKALLHFQKCLDIQINSPSRNNLDLVDTLSRTGEVYRKQNNPSDALAQDQSALEILLPYVSSKDVILAKKWIALGTDYRMLDDYQQSLTAFNQSLEILSNNVPSERLDIAFIHREMGLIFYDTEQHEKALSYFQQCLTIRKSLLSPEHLDLAEIQSSIGNALCKLNHLSDALMSYQYALDIQLKHLPQSCLKTIKTWENLGWVYYRLGQYDEALSTFNECLEYQLNVLPSNHIDISTIHKRIATVYYQTGKYEEFLLSMQACLDIEMRWLPSALMTAGTQSAMGSICRKLNRFSDALYYYQYALDIELKHLPSTNLKVIETYRNLGNLYGALKQYDNSLSAYNECLKYQLNALPSNHIDISDTHKIIALVYGSVKKVQRSAHKLSRMFSYSKEFAACRTS